MPNLHSIRYGRSSLQFTVDENIICETIIPSVIPGVTDPVKEVERALENTIGFDWTRLGKVMTVAMAINDKTRPVPHKYLLPPLLQKLDKLGIQRENIRFVIATGTHAPMKFEEFIDVLPKDIISNYQVDSHDCDDVSNLTFLGKTSAGTPVWVNQRYYEADLKIVIGNIEPHHFMGFSGGNKSASIGVTGRKTINQNHSFLLDDRSRLGSYEDNPMRQDVEEIGKLIGVNLALNVILNDNKEIVQAIAGDPIQVIQKGHREAARLCQVPVSGFYDLVIASAGGYPKDINLYQAQKALTNAALITRDGGTVILVTECEEGIGSNGYVQFMQGVSTFKEAIEKFSRMEFEVGPHKAYQFAKIGSRINVAIKSIISPDVVKSLLLQPVEEIQSVINENIKVNGQKLRIAVLPLASITLPKFS